MSHVKSSLPGRTALVRPGLALAVVLLGLTTASAYAFDPNKDKPAAAYGDVSSPRNLPDRSTVDPATIGPDMVATFTACYTLARDASIGKLWQQWTNDRTGDWFYLYAAPTSGGFELTYYKVERGAIRLASGLQPNQTHEAGDDALPGAALPIGSAGSAAAFRLGRARIDVPAEATCGPEADERLVPAAFSVGLVWARETTGWPETTVTLRQAIETGPIPSGRGATVFFDGWTVARGHPGQLTLGSPATPSGASSQTEPARQIDLGIAVVLGRMADLVHVVERIVMALAALAVGAPAVWIGRRRLRQAAVDVWHSTPPFANALWCDVATAVRAEDRTHLAALTGVSLVGLGLRLVYLDQPIRGDEAYTYLTYASQPLWTALSTYNAPNNHVLHSVLVHVTSRLFGDDAWALRLPAFAAGVMLVPATYLVGRRLYGREVGLLAAALAAASSVLVEYATNARGYSLIALALLGLLWLGPALLRDGSPAGWFLFALVAALGLFTVPTMLYGVAAVGLWLLLSIALGAAGHGRVAALRGLITAGLAACLLAAILYGPILLVHGPRALLANEFVQAQSWDALVVNARLMVLGTWDLWNRDLPPIASGAIGLGFVGAALALEPFRRARAPLAPVVLILVAFVVGLQRVAPPPRSWLFLLPVYFLIAASLWGPLLARGLARAGLPAAPATAVLAAALSLGLSTDVVRSGSILDSTETGVLRDARDITRFLGGYLESRDRVLEMTPSGPELLYYFKKQGISNANLYTDLSTAPRAIVVVNKQWRQSLGDVLRYWSVDGSWLESSRVLREYPSATLYEAVNPRP